MRGLRLIGAPHVVLARKTRGPRCETSSGDVSRVLTEIGSLEGASLQLRGSLKKLALGALHTETHINLRRDPRKSEHARRMNDSVHGCLRLIMTDVITTINRPFDGNSGVSLSSRTMNLMNSNIDLGHIARCSLICFSEHLHDPHTFQGCPDPC